MKHELAGFIFKNVKFAFAVFEKHVKKNVVKRHDALLTALEIFNYETGLSRAGSFGLFASSSCHGNDSVSEWKSLFLDVDDVN